MGLEKVEEGRRVYPMPLPVSPNCILLNPPSLTLLSPSITLYTTFSSLGDILLPTGLLQDSNPVWLFRL